MNLNKLNWVTGAFLALNLMAAAGVRAGEVASQTNAAPPRIGIYDSRAIAVAFAGSAAYQQWLKPIKADYDRAKAAGDTNRMKRIDADMHAHQTRAHAQAFSTALVDDLLKHIEGSLEQIKQKTGVCAIVSKWDTEALKKHPSAEKIDVTMLLVDEFHPNERQRQSAIEIQKHKPITLEEAQSIKD